MLKRSLVRRRIAVYIAEHDLQLGRSLSKKIQDAIEGSDALIAIVTHGESSPSVNQEVGYATKVGIPVIPFVEEGAKVGFMLGDIEQMRFNRSNVQRACEKVASYLLGKLRTEEENPLLYPEEEREEELINESKIIDDYEVYSYRLEEGSILKGRINSDIPINVFIVDTRNLNLFEDDYEFNYDDGSERVTRYSVNFEVPKTRDWHVIIDNENDAPAEVDLHLSVRFE